MNTAPSAPVTPARRPSRRPSRRVGALRRAGVLAVAATLALSLAACGQKAGVGVQPGVVSADGTFVDPTTGETVAAPEGFEPGQVIDPSTGEVLPGGSTDTGGTGSGFGDSPGGTTDPGGTTNPDGTTAPGGTDPGPGGAQPGPGDPGAPGEPGEPGDEGTPPPTEAPADGDTTGVTDDTIKIGVHAPVTGAAAIPQASFERAIGVYFDAVNRRGGFFGRQVEVFFQDDQFRPDVARARCKELAEQEQVFMLIGGAGADQIDACARYAAEVGVPYVSAGVHQSRPGQVPLGDLGTYLALSLTYEQQVPLLTRAYSQAGGGAVVVITADNDSLSGYHAATESAFRSAAGGNFKYAERIPKSATSEALSIATRICQSGATKVVWNASPSVLINVSKSMTCRPTFIGPGLTNGLNIVATAGCDNINGALFYSPFPGLDVMRRNADFVRDYRAKNGGDPDDIGAAIYGIERVVGAMLTAAGENLTREGFLAAAARTRNFSGGGIYPQVTFDDRFGGTAMHLLRADCGRNEYVTAAQNVKP